MNATTPRRRTARPQTPAELATAYPITVIIPAYNAADFLEQSLRALAANDRSQVEVLVVDDASDDATPHLVGEKPQELPIEVIRLTRRSGPAAARNAGAQKARFPFLFFLDADVVLPPQAIFWIRESLDLYSHRPEVSGVLGIYSEQLPDRGFFSNYKNLYTCFLYETTETLSPFVHTPMFCVRRDVLLQAGGFDPGSATAEDFELGVRLGLAGHRFVIDWRIRGVHLKRYTLKSVLAEDARRIRDLRSLRLSREGTRFAYRAHRWHRLLSLALPGLTLGSLALCFWSLGFAYVAVFLLLAFAAVNAKFWRFSARRKGIWFATKALAFLFVEMLWAELALLKGIAAKKKADTAQAL